MAAGDFGVPLKMTIGPRSGPGSEGSKGSEGVRQFGVYSIVR